jgi:hypothetical protein
MRARQRHFNMRDAGAIASYDSRFISGLSNSDPVNTWNDRSRSANNATQTGADRPVYTTNAINGLPALNLAVGKHMIIDSITNPNSSTFMAAERRPSSGDTMPNFGKPSTDLYIYIWFADNVIYERYNNTQPLRTVATGQTQTGNFITCSVKNGTTSSQHYRNGLTIGSQGTPPASNSDFTRIGFYTNALGNNAADGIVGNYTLCDVAVGRPLQKRMEHSLAHSFKIACN